MKGLLLFLFVFFFLVWSLNAFAASCTNPDLSISVSPIKTYVGGRFDVNLVFSADPPPLTNCVCAPGNNCGVQWQDDTNGEWAQIPNSTDVDLDLNCSGRNCSTGIGYPVEDQVYNQSIQCVDQNTYRMRGFHPLSNKSTQIITVYCYPSRQCQPPETGNFNLNQTCEYKYVPVFIDQNYNILGTGKAIHSNSDINFFSTGPKFLNIQNGGQMDLNQSSLITGLLKGGKIFWFLSPFLLIIFIFAFLSPLGYNKKVRF